jgi:hypothetical protein
MQTHALAARMAEKGWRTDIGHLADFSYGPFAAPDTVHQGFKLYFFGTLIAQSEISWSGTVCLVIVRLWG